MLPLNIIKRRMQGRLCQVVQVHARPHPPFIKTHSIKPQFIVTKCFRKKSTSKTNQSKTFANSTTFGVSCKVANYFPIRFEFVNEISFFVSKGHLMGAPVFRSSYARAWQQQLTPLPYNFLERLFPP